MFLYPLQKCVFLMFQQSLVFAYLVYLHFFQFKRFKGFSTKKIALTPFSVAPGLRKNFCHVLLWREMQFCLGSCRSARALGQVGQHCCGADLLCCWQVEWVFQLQSFFWQEDRRTPVRPVKELLHLRQEVRFQGWQRDKQTSSLTKNQTSGRLAWKGVEGLLCLDFSSPRLHSNQFLIHLIHVRRWKQTHLFNLYTLHRSHQ